MGNTRGEREERMGITRNSKLISMLVLIALAVPVAGAKSLAAAGQISAGDITMEISLFGDYEVFNNSSTAGLKGVPELSVCEVGVWEAFASGQTDLTYCDQVFLGESQNAYLLLIDNGDEDSRSTLLWRGGDTESMINRQCIADSKTVCETGSVYGVVGMSSIGAGRQNWGSMF